MFSSIRGFRVFSGFWKGLNLTRKLFAEHVSQIWLWCIHEEWTSSLWLFSEYGYPLWTRCACVDVCTQMKNKHLWMKEKQVDFTEQFILYSNWRLKKCQKYKWCVSVSVHRKHKRKLTMFVHWLQFCQPHRKKFIIGGNKWKGWQRVLLFAYMCLLSLHNKPFKRKIYIQIKKIRSVIRLCSHWRHSMWGHMKRVS